MDCSSAISNNNEKMDEHLKSGCKRKNRCSSITSVSEGKKKKKNNNDHATIKKELKSIFEDIDLFEPIVKLKRPKKKEKKKKVELTKDSEHISQLNNTSVEIKRENVAAYEKSIEKPKKKQVPQNNAATMPSLRKRYSKNTASRQLRKEKYAKLRARQKARIMETKKRRENDIRKMGLLVPLLSSLGPFVPKKKNSYVQLKTHIAQRAALLFQPPKQTTIKGEEAGNSSSMSFMSGWNKTTLNNLSRLKNRPCLGSGSSSKSRPPPSLCPSPSPSPSTTEPQWKPSGLLIRRDYRINNWSESELDALWLGVRRHGQGNWKAIIADSRLFPASLRHKTPQELSIMWNKDKLKLFPSRLVSPPSSSSVPLTNTPQRLQPQPQPPPPPPPSALDKNKEKEVINDRAETSILTPTQLDRVPPHMYLDYGIKRVQEKHSVKSSINFPSVVHDDDASGNGSVPPEKGSSSSGLSHGVTTHDHQHASAPPCQRPLSPVYGLLATIEESSSRVCDGNQTALSSMKRLLPETEKEKVVISESEDDDTKPQRLLLGGQFQLSNILDQMKKNKNYAQQKKNIEAGTSSNPFHIDSD